MKLRREATGTAPPVPPEASVWRDHAGAVAAYGFTVDGSHWMRLPGIASYRFSAGVDEVASFAEPGVPEERVRAAYHRTVQPLALHALGWEVLHASAVRMGSGVVALCALSRIGKSTLAYALSRRGHAVFADDAVPYDLSGTTPRAVPVPFELHLRPEVASFFGVSGLDRSEEEDGEPVPLAALCVLERLDSSRPAGRATVRRIKPSASFTRVLNHAYCFDLESRERRDLMVERYLELVSRVPVFEVRLSDGLVSLEPAVDAIERAMERALA
jgi:hypothetical protein